MRIVVATTSVPFVSGGASIIVDWLERALVERGHEVDVFTLPFRAHPPTMTTQMVGLRSLDFSDRCDRLIAVRTPSHLVQHPRKSVWFLHHHRPAYDLWNSAPDVPHDADGREFRRMLFASDEAALAESNVFCNSDVIRRRLADYNGVDAEILYPPLDPAGGYAMEQAEDTIVYVSRLMDHKRQLLAVQALATTQTPVRLHLVGAFDATDDSYRRSVLETITRYDLQDRVTLSEGWVDEQTKRSIVARALAVAYFPFDEDSYGYPSLEAAAMGRPVVTTTDSGGVTELVEDEVNGLVVEPDAPALGAAFDRLWEDRALADKLGAGQAAKVAALKISWDHVTERLLA